MSIRFVLLGHVDHGKSTLAGRILLDTGSVEDREVEKIKKEADENKMSSWWLSYITDIDSSERKKGKTHAFNTCEFTYDEQTIELIDVPGHKLLVSEMINGASFANVAVLLVSARKGEFEQGLSGQTMEHVMIARGMGLNSLIVAVNKMDSVDWDLDVFEDIKTKLTKKLKKINFKNTVFVPVSAYDGDNVVNVSDKTKEINRSLLQTILDFNTVEKKDEFIKVNDKNCVCVQFVFFAIDGVVSVGTKYMIHTKDRYYEAEIVYIKNGKNRFVTEDNMIDKKTDKRNQIYAIIKFLDKVDDIHTNLVVRTSDKTVGCAKVVDGDRFRKMIAS